MRIKNQVFVLGTCTLSEPPPHLLSLPSYHSKMLHLSLFPVTVFFFTSFPAVSEGEKHTLTQVDLTDLFDLITDPVKPQVFFRTLMQESADGSRVSDQ